MQLGILLDQSGHVLLIDHGLNMKIIIKKTINKIAVHNCEIYNFVNLEGKPKIPQLFYQKCPS